MALVLREPEQEVRLVAASWKLSTFPSDPSPTQRYLLGCKRRFGDQGTDLLICLLVQIRKYFLHGCGLNCPQLFSPRRHNNCSFFQLLAKARYSLTQ